MNYLVVLMKFNHIFSLMAKLEKADQAFCFTSGMAALAAVTHLIQSGKHSAFFSASLSHTWHSVLYKLTGKTFGFRTRNCCWRGHIWWI